MKFKMARNSVFAILLRSSWWISAGIALLLLAASQALSNPLFSTFLLFAAVPFLVISAISGWKRRDMPSAERVEQTMTAVRAMSWPAFSELLEDAFRQDGCDEVKRLAQGPVDFELRRKSRLAVVGARRWKASRVGVQALQELAAARVARGAHEAIYVTTGEVSEQALAYAREHQVQFLAERELTRLLPRHLLGTR